MSLFKLNYNWQHCSAISLTVIMFCVCARRLCVKITVLVCKAVRLAFSCQTSAISFPLIPIPCCIWGVLGDDISRTLERIESKQPYYTTLILTHEINLAKWLFKDTKKVDDVLESSFNFFSFTLCHLSNIRNQRRYSSHLLNPMIIVTPCIADSRGKFGKMTF